MKILASGDANSGLYAKYNISKPPAFLIADIVARWRKADKFVSWPRLPERSAGADCCRESQRWRGFIINDKDHRN